MSSSSSSILFPFCFLRHPPTAATATATTSKQSSSPQLLSPMRVTVAVAISLSLSLINCPLPSFAIPSLNYSSSSLVPPVPTTPFSQSKNLPLGLEDGKIRPCPSLNPGCMSSNPKSSSFAFPWTIPTSLRDDNPLQKLKDSILKTQKNPKILVIEDTPYGQYLQAEVDGGFGSRDVLEFLVKGDVVSYRNMATKVTYVYPFTTALGDSKGQEQRLKQIVGQLGWNAPSFDAMD